MVNVGYNRKVPEDTAHCSLLCMALHSCRSLYNRDPFTPGNNYNGHVNIRSGPAVEEGSLVWWIMFSFTLCEWLCACATLTWWRDGTMVQFGKRSSWRFRRETFIKQMLICIKLLNWIGIWGNWSPSQHLELFLMFLKAILNNCCSVSEHIILLKKAAAIREYICHEGAWFFGHHCVR